MSLLVAPDPSWQAAAHQEAARWRETAISGLIVLHHIGSTSVPGLPAKPVIDLLPVFDSPASAQAARPALERLGYIWRGENGLEGRCYATRPASDTGALPIHAHAYAQGHPAIARHLAFRDALTANAALRAAYAAVKAAAAARHPEGGQAYVDAKGPWIEKTTNLALQKHAAPRSEPPSCPPP